MATPVAHSKLGASNSKRWIGCPGSVAMADLYLEQKAGRAALEGTAAHAWAEFCLANGEIDCDGYIDVEEFPTPELAAIGWKLTREMADAINVYLEFVWTVCGADDELHVERRVSLEFIATGMFGTNDCSVLKKNGTLHVIDYKHGAGVYVEASRNPQIMFYALGALHAFAKVQPITKIVATIVQPRAMGEPVRSQEFDPLEIWEFGLELKDAAERTREPNAPRIPGSYCTFCPGTKGSRCLEYQNKAIAVATDPFEVIVPPEIMSADEMGRRLSQVGMLKQWCKSFEEFANEQARKGNIPTGFKWVAGRGKREWASDDLTMLTLADEKGIDISEPAKALSPSKVEKQFGKKVFAQLADHVTKIYSSPQLVVESDKRPALDILTLGADAFETLEHPENE